MDLWIRTQNKKALIKVNELFIVKSYKDYMITNYPMDYPNDDVNGGLNLGIYKTKERALEVLDEIQEYIQHDCIDRDFVATIYEMPKE